MGPPPSTSTTLASTTTSTTPELTTTTTLPAAEVCGNCVDDNGNGLIDAEDPECCATPLALTVTDARFRPAKSTLRVHATLPDGTFAGLTPRQQNVHLQIRGVSGELMCCTIPAAQWQRLFQRTFGYFDQKMTICPPLRCLSLALPRKGQPRTTIIVGRVKPGSPFLVPPLEITLSADDQCAAGPVSLQQKAHGRMVFP